MVFDGKNQWIDCRPPKKNRYCLYRGLRESRAAADLLELVGFHGGQRHQSRRKSLWRGALDSDVGGQKRQRWNMCRNAIWMDFVGDLVGDLWVIWF